jgi:EmrB/QacA subfamily drug resistance transporter
LRIEARLPHSFEHPGVSLADAGERAGHCHIPHTAFAPLRLELLAEHRIFSLTARGARCAPFSFVELWFVLAPSAPPAPARLDHKTVRQIILGLMLAMFLSALDQTIVATALATIGRAYGEVESLTWVVTAYLLAATVVVPIYGKLSDIYGRRPALLTGIAIFVAGSVACALAPTMPALIAARALQGLGGGGLIALSQTIVGDAVSPRERGRYQGYFGAVFATASIAGPVVGGVLAEHLHWSLIFWINLPLGLLAFAISGRALKLLPRHERPHKLDLLGAALMVCATVTFLLALNWGGVRYAWASPQIVGLAGTAVFLFALFGARLSIADEPFISLEIMRNRVVAAAIGCASFAYGTMIAVAIYTPVYFEGVLHLTASEAGLALIPFMGGVVIGSTGSGRLMAQLTHYKRIGLVGLPLAAAAFVPLAVMPDRLSIAVVAVLLFIAGNGLGTVLPITTVSVQNAVLPWQLGTVTGVINFVRALTSALMVALYGAILFGGMGAARGVTLEALAGRNADAFTGHFRWIFAAASLSLALAFLLLLLMEERPLRTAPAARGEPQAAPAE